MADKRPKSSVATTKAKFPSSASGTTSEKLPKTAYVADPMKMTPSWRFGRIQTAHPWGWHEVAIADARFVCEKLMTYEGKTWTEILVKECHWNHRMEKYRLCKAAQDRLTELALDDLEFLVSLRLGSTQRVWGYLDHNVYNILWWDPEHEVYPTFKKNT